jgi:hypothetical protein
VWRGDLKDCSQRADTVASQQIPSVMLQRFFEGAEERLQWLAETKNNICVHIVGMKLNLNGLLNNAICVSAFSGEYRETECGVLS